MVHIICTLEKIGGITGKRVHVKRVEKIYVPDQYKESDIWNFKQGQVRINLCKHFDVLNTAENLKGRTDSSLDRFMRLMNDQGQRFDGQKLDYADTLALVEYEGGKVTDIELVEVEEIINYLETVRGETPLKGNTWLLHAVYEQIADFMSKQ